MTKPDKAGITEATNIHVAQYLYQCLVCMFLLLFSINSFSQVPLYEVNSRPLSFTPDLNAKNPQDTQRLHYRYSLFERLISIKKSEKEKLNCIQENRRGLDNIDRLKQEFLVLNSDNQGLLFKDTRIKKLKLEGQV